jgi:hypothetical protein
VNGSLSTYVASSFQQHSLSGLPTAMADAFSAAVFLPVAKMMDTWGRAEGFLLMAICATIGLVLMAACDSFSIYCAANVSCALAIEAVADVNMRSRCFTTLASVAWNSP